MLRMIAVSVSLAVLSASAFSAVAAPAVQRLRGTIESAGDGKVTIKTMDGKMLTLSVAPDTRVAYVVKSSLGQIKDGVFIGTATKGENPPVALEVVVFPEAMRGTGEGHYDWDEINDTTGGSGAVTNVKAAAKPLVKSAMTNGTIKTSASAGETKKLTVTYGDGKSIDITVPPTAPVVTFEPASPAALTPGAHVFAVAADENGMLAGKRLLVGKDGLVPPM